MHTKPLRIQKDEGGSGFSCVFEIVKEGACECISVSVLVREEKKEKNVAKKTSHLNSYTLIICDREPRRHGTLGRKRNLNLSVEAASGSVSHMRKSCDGSAVTFYLNLTLPSLRSPL